MSRRRAGRASVDDVLAKAEEAPVEAPIEVTSSRSRRRQVNFEDEDSVNASGVGALAQEAASLESAAAVRRSRFQPSAVEESGEGEDVQKEGQSDIHPQELAGILRTKSEVDRSQSTIMEVFIPSARINMAQDPPLQLLNVTKSDFGTQVCHYCMSAFLVPSSAVSL
jgi:hypothetical protein